MSGQMPQATAPAAKPGSFWSPDISTNAQAIAYMRAGGAAAIAVGFLIIATAASGTAQIAAALLYGGLAIGLFCYSRVAAVVALLWAAGLDLYLVFGGMAHRVVGGFVGEQHLVPAPGTALGMHMALRYPPAFSAEWWAAALPCFAMLALTWMFVQAVRAAFLYHDLSPAAVRKTS